MITELQLSNSSIADWASLCREVLVLWCVKQKRKIGGQDLMFEIGENKFGHRKYNVGILTEGRWLFGGLLGNAPASQFPSKKETVKHF